MDRQSITSFNFGVNPVRVAIVAGEPWWIAPDVCSVLDIANSRDALGRLDPDERGVAIADTPGGPQQVSTINESGLYSLVLTSRKPEAKAFKKWITSEVIPSIRRTGAYSVVPAFKVPKTLQEALLFAAELEGQRSALECKVQAQAQDIAALEPMAAVAQSITLAQDAQTFDQAAKVLGTGPNRLFATLRAWRWIKPGSTLPYQDQVDNGNFTVKEILYKDKHKVDRISTKTYITGKGLVAIQKRMDSEAPRSLLSPQHR